MARWRALVAALFLLAALALALELWPSSATEPSRARRVRVKYEGRAKKKRPRASGGPGAVGWPAASGMSEGGGDDGREADALRSSASPALPTCGAMLAKAPPVDPAFFTDGALLREAGTGAALAHVWTRTDLTPRKH